jgi:predicted nucleotidyltransferase
MHLTQTQQELFDTIVRILEADPEIQGVWLGGSLGKGTGDAWSDVDVVIMVADPQKTGARYLAKIPEIAEPALITPMFGGSTINVVTADWRRFDLDFAAPDNPKLASPNRRLIFNRSGREIPARAPQAYTTPPDALLKLVNEFIRVAGITPVVIGRKEWVLSLSGMDALRRLTIDLMLEENGYSPMNRGGALHRNNMLTPEQVVELEAMTPVAASRDGAVTAVNELSAIFLPRARRLAAKVGMAWPERFEKLTRDHLKRELGIVFG